MKTKIAYLECPTGIAGDMCLGALVHAGVPLEYLDEQLRRLEVQDEFHLWAETVNRNGQVATKVHVDLLKGDGSEYGTFVGAIAPDAASPHEVIPPHSHSHDPAPKDVQAKEGGDRPLPHRHLPDIEQRIQAANLPPRASQWSLAVFRQLAAAEAAVHGIPIDQVHFHEVGATDALVDIVGTCLGLDWLQIDALYCSALPMGGGTIRAAHGQLPVPAPAVLKLWEMGQVPIYSNGIERELVTPTGAALVTTLAQGFGAPPPLRLQRVGLGAGNRVLPLPNILRLWLGEAWSPTRSTATATETIGAIAPALSPQIPHHAADHRHPHSHPAPTTTATAAPEIQPEPTLDPGLGAETDRVVVLETQVDDLTPQAIAYTQELLFAAGALDVFCGAIAMKKSRLGTLITVICPPTLTATCEAILFRETTTLGIRRSHQERTILKRHLTPIETPYGSVQIKVAHHQEGGPVLNAYPEYEDCARLARHHNLPWQHIHQSALQAWHSAHPLLDQPIESPLKKC